MRKSRYVTFLLAASLSSCDQNSGDTTDAVLYSDPSACAKEIDTNLCNEAFAAAQTEHVQQAPKFASQAECEAAGFAQCQQTEVKTAQGTGGSFFMPMMMGYMMGRMMSPGAPGAASRMGAPTTARPVYSDRGGYLYAGGSSVGRLAPGSTSLGPSGMATRVTSRGGFGASARSFGGGGT
jgi:uncharacterized protein YgiB involved in biofilm formation